MQAAVYSGNRPLQIYCEKEKQRDIWVLGESFLVADGYREKTEKL